MKRWLIYSTLRLDETPIENQVNSLHISNLYF
jgi:hypothetical protein